jgi:hypothetical protein
LGGILLNEAFGGEAADVAIDAAVAAVPGMEQIAGDFSGAVLVADQFNIFPGALVTVNRHRADDLFSGGVVFFRHGGLL